MSLSSDQVGQDATSFVDRAHHRQDIDVDFNKLDLRDQFRVTRAIKHMNEQFETDHPDLPKVTIETFNDGQLKELDVKGRLWGWNSCYSRDKDPGVPNPVNQGFKSIINGIKEAFDP
jgi:hypothetical protein